MDKFDIEYYTNLLDALTDAERKELFHSYYCKYCTTTLRGSQRCYCMRDD